MRTRSRLVAAVLAAATLGSAPALAGGLGAWVRAEQADLRLVSATEAIGPGQDRLRLGLHVRLETGWKIYWRSPGSAGLPPRLDWDGSANLGQATLRWPAPQRFELFGLQSYGYAGEVVLPIEARLVEPGAPAVLGARVEYLVCREICIPGAARVALDLPAGPPTPSAAAHLIDRFAGRVPAPAAAAGVTLAAEIGTGALVVTARGSHPFVAPDLFVETAALPDLPAPRVSLAEGGRTARFTFPDVALPAGTRLTATVVDGPVAIEGETVALAAARGLGAVLAIALIGGLILNLMPCVLPVLALKVTGLAGLAGAQPGAARRSLLATAAGVALSMLALGAALAGLRAAGASIGWGVQFQQPVFLAFMAALTGLFAFNLWGLFAIGAPRWAGTLAEAAPRRGLAGDLATGAFATLLATPCSAPFVGTAAAWALTRGTGEILAVFAALGAGLALPWVALAAVPRLAALLPRPGAWMIRLRAAMGVLLAATSAWLMTVLASQAGTEVAAGVAASLAAAGAALWLARGRRAALPAAVALALGAVALPAFPGAPPAPPPPAGTLAFSAVEAERRARSGETLLVDITAEWCITCQVNKALVLERGAVAELLRAGAVGMMRGDWTRPDPAITAYLARHGRVGIPFNAVYGPAAPEGIALPEILTESTVLDAVARAGGTRAQAAR
ncbi:protein-disulfide reductase DsbD [Elioraea sp.]|uniref:protein-disulfide reductase DsbD family protein n=1 Tax=Elioraea sp. TaxID=2185103 RepID=UPI0021DDE4D4|nr:protein-disulfide reductase DsbD domain-containing protein [Elioraea sp.]GIX10025.1 MAG: suppressor for copper-sensitivity B [Elioraea sp.]